MFKDESKLNKYLLTIFLILATTCMFFILIAYIIAFIPYVKINEWDLLAFIGSMVVAVITILGIRVPLLNQKKEQLIVKYENELKQLHRVNNNDMRYILKVESEKILDIETDEVDRHSTLQLHADYLNDYINSLNGFIPSLIESLDWDFYQKFEEKYSSLGGFSFYYDGLEINYLTTQRFGLLEEKINNYLKIAVELQTLLLDYQKIVHQKYDEIKNKPVFFKL
ncbi:hypothetical protein NST44_05270 [Paenibacillus sp. FSL W8-0919]|uniref:hypothetical protein n=1 Tax=Paenibacillus sp. FSL W8-0919 TaxID=2954707 RepID=UPI0030FAF2B6